MKLLLSVHRLLVDGDVQADILPPSRVHVEKVECSNLVLLVPE